MDGMEVAMKRIITIVVLSAVALLALSCAGTPKTKTEAVASAEDEKLMAELNAEAAAQKEKPIPIMAVEPNPPVAGRPVKALYTEPEKPNFFGWYIFEEREIIFKDGMPVGVKQDANWTALPKYTNSITLPPNSAGKYLFVNAGRDAAHQYSEIQRALPTLIAAE